MATLNMAGHIDSVFQSIPAQRQKYLSTDWTTGFPVGGPDGAPQDKVVTLQALTDAERENLDIGAERVVDFRKLYVNDGDEYSEVPADTWTFTGLGGVWKTLKVDSRPWRNYAKIIIARKDDT